MLKAFVVGEIETAVPDRRSQSSSSPER